MNKSNVADQNYSKQPFLLSVDEILSHLETKKESGLNSSQVQQNRQKYGDNKLDGEGEVSWYSILLKQVSNAMVLVSQLHRM